MVYSTDDEYGQHRGYTDFADFQNSETIPNDAGLEEIRKEANALVNVAFHGEEGDAEVFTETLKAYELRVMDRMVHKGRLMDSNEDPSPVPFLSQEELEYLRELGRSDDSIMSLRTKSLGEHNFSYGDRGWLY